MSAPLNWTRWEQFTRGLEPGDKCGSGRIETRSLGLDRGAEARGFGRVRQLGIKIGPDGLAIEFDRVGVPGPVSRRTHHGQHLAEPVAHMARIGNIGLPRGERLAEQVWLVWRQEEFSRESLGPGRILREGARLCEPVAAGYPRSGKAAR